MEKQTPSKLLRRLAIVTAVTHVPANFLGGLAAVRTGAEDADGATWRDDHPASEPDPCWALNVTNPPGPEALPPERL